MAKKSKKQLALKAQPDKFNAGEWEIVDGNGLVQGRGYEDEAEANAAIPNIKSQLSS